MAEREGVDLDHTFDEPTLAGALNAAGKSFVGYVETGSPRKHNPGESFANARATERNFSEFPRDDFTRLLTIIFVIPNLNHDMHDGSVHVGDTWLKVHFGGYAEWAKTRNSLLIITFDEDDKSAKNHITTIIYGAHVRPGDSVLSTLLALYGLYHISLIRTRAPISAVRWT